MSESSFLLVDALDLEPGGTEVRGCCVVVVLEAGGRGGGGLGEGGGGVAADFGLDGGAGCVGVLPLSALLARCMSRMGVNQAYEKALELYMEKV